MEKVAGHVITTAMPGRARHASRTAGGSATSSSTRSSRSTPSTGRRPGSRASASRPATSSASCGASSGLLGAQQDARDPAVERVGAVAAGEPPGVGAGDRSSTATTGSATSMFAPERAGAADRDLRLGDGDDRRPARRPRLPVHDVGRARRPVAGHVRAHRRHARGGLPAARRADRALRGALRALDDRHPLVPDARAVEVDRVHGGQLQARASPAPPTTRSSRASARASCELAERAEARRRVAT